MFSEQHGGTYYRTRSSDCVKRTQTTRSNKIVSVAQTIVVQDSDLAGSGKGEDD
jgi:hypothetical protein